MSADKKSIFVWSPFISKVGTVQNVINSLNSFNKYSNLNTNLINVFGEWDNYKACLLYTSPSPRDGLLSRMPSSA